jgi:hypothetical protein
MGFLIFYTFVVEPIGKGRLLNEREVTNTLKSPIIHMLVNPIMPWELTTKPKV